MRLPGPTTCATAPFGFRVDVARPQQSLVKISTVTTQKSRSSASAESSAKPGASRANSPSGSCDQLTLVFWTAPATAGDFLRYLADCIEQPITALGDF